MQHLRARTGVCEKNDPRPHVRVGSPAPHPRISMLPATAARVRAAAKKTTLLVPSPPAPWINIEIRGERGGALAVQAKVREGRFFRKHRTRHIVFVRFVPTNFGARPGFPGIYSAHKRAAKPA